MMRQGRPTSLERHVCFLTGVFLCALGGAIASVSLAAPDASDDDMIARSLAEMLRDARAIVSDNQSAINDPELGDKGLSAKVVLDQAMQTYKRNSGVDPMSIDPNSRHGRLLRAMMAAITEVMDANQSTINAKGIGFKAFIPAVFGRLVAESFARLAHGEAELKVTAPRKLVRNRKALPDGFEERIIKTKLEDASWPHSQPYSEMTDAKGRPAYRVMVPEYYTASCLSCHGGPKGELDITGYPKEGASENDLGGVISLTLYR
jgi:uncharacterized protein DUF3365